MTGFIRLLTVPFFLSSMICAAYAEAITAERATELLAKSQTINNKCSFLSVVEQNELSTMVARAEIALAEQQSVSDASAALARGKAAGKLATCSELEKAEVTGILSAAKMASADVPEPQVAEEKSVESQAIPPEEKNIAMEQPKPVEVAPLQVAKLEPKKRLLPTQTKKIAAKKLKPKNEAGLAQYASITQRYYLQRRCGTLQAKAMNSLYQNVVATHQKTLLEFGRDSTAAVMRRAEARAKSLSCS